MVRFSTNFLDFPRDLDNSFNFFHFNFWIAFDGPSTYYIISRGRTEVGGVSKISTIDKIRKRDSYFQTLQYFQNNSHRPQYQDIFSNTKNLNDLMNILRFCNSYMVSILDFCTHMKNSLNSILPSVHPDFRIKNFVRRCTNNQKAK